MPISLPAFASLTLFSNRALLEIVILDSLLSNRSPLLFFVFDALFFHGKQPPFIAHGAQPSLRGTLGWIVSVPRGREYLARVPGASQSLLNDERLAAVINWVLTEFNSATLADDFRPLTAAEVGKARSDVLMNPLKLRAELWRKYEGS